MLKTSINIHDLIELNLTPQHLRYLGWTLDMFKSIGGDKESLKKLCSESDMSLYFSHHAMKSIGIEPKKKKQSGSSKLIF